MKFEIINDKEIKKCAPSKKYEEGSCFTFEALIKIAKEYNKYNKDKIILDDIKSKKELLTILKNKISNCGDNQLCWFKEKLFYNIDDDDILYNTFRPNGPIEKTKWLNTTNINKILYQYEYKYKDFIFLGAVPIDFEKINIHDIANINFDELIKNNKSKIGLVINLDEHWQSGSHWVAVYADIKNNQIYFFDSYATKPKKRIAKFMLKIALWCYYRNILNDTNNNYNIKNFFNYVKINDTIDIRYNNIRHQYKNSECGVYSVNFILRLLKGDSFDTIIKEKTNDDNINTCRNVYFSFQEKN